MRKGRRGIPSFILKTLLKSKKAQIDTGGTEKVTVMKGGPKLTKLIEASVYDTNPVHYISMFSEELKWVVTDNW